jgi:sugar phosphate isomerase/epimerase
MRAGADTILHLRQISVSLRLGTEFTVNIDSPPSSRAGTRVTPLAHPEGLAARALVRLSIHQTTTIRWSLRELIAECVRTGVRGIGVSLPKLVVSGTAEGARLIRESGLSVSSLGWVGGFTGTHGHSYAEAVRDAQTALDLASALEAAAIIVMPGARLRHIRSHARRLVIDALSELAVDLPATSRLALQPMHPLFANEWSFLSNLDETLDVLDRINHPRVGLAFGTYHLWQEPRLIERIPEFISRIAAVQLSDWREPPRCDNDRLLPGDGLIPLAEIISALESAGYRGLYEIEVWSRDLWKRDHHSLIRECLQRFERLAPCLA